MLLAGSGRILQSLKGCLRIHRGITSRSVEQLLEIQEMEQCGEAPSRAIVLGVFADEKDKTDPGLLTDIAWRYNIEKTEGRLLYYLRMSGVMPKVGEARIFYCIEPAKIPYYTAVAMVGLGTECLGYNTHEVVDERKDAIRRSVASACKILAFRQTSRIDVESCYDAEAAAEGAALGVYAYQGLKSPAARTYPPAIDLYSGPDVECDIKGWRIGWMKAEAQNLTRNLQETPANLLTPTNFAQTVVSILCKSRVNAEVMVEDWAESQQMNAFLAVSKASCETPIFLELSYYGASREEAPIVLVGQGITYDSGGLCLKEMKELYHMRGDMTGAAVVVAAMKAVAELKLRLNIRGLIPLCENVMGCNAFRPGDVVKSMNGKNIEVQGTDHEDMLVLSDALQYAQNYCPRLLIDIGSTSGGMRPTLGEAACGVFTNSEIVWQKFKNASIHTGDRVWRMPLWNYYLKQITSNEATDIQNYGVGRGGRPCKAAAFLKEFVPCGQWAHLDVTNVVYTRGTDFEYLSEGMAGRPTRTLIEFLAQTLCKDTAPKLSMYQKIKENSKVSTPPEEKC